ncbi:U3 snoRNP protein [Mycoemilia scoparia]|uniref:U3 small nucleolar RNA-associated protein 18 homolog n=1 Tax=Mycoemilia scoparia TaxID=417184 RepID=A0A9W8DTE0_9FUNG|nr:U3 snoRNP protein [Mycoemilia scoparia]
MSSTDIKQRKRQLEEPSDNDAKPQLVTGPKKSKKKKSSAHKVAPKTTDELELENLVFGGGDDENIAQGIFESAGHELEMSSILQDKVKNDDVGGGEKEVKFSGDEGEGDVMFFEDTGANEDQFGLTSDIIIEASKVQNSKKKSKAKKKKDVAQKSAWKDEDDKNIEISVMSNTRTKKLRQEEGEDVLTGEEYENRLRKQFEKINPVPAWAIKKDAKKSKADSGDDSDEELEAPDEEAIESIDLSFFKSNKSLIESNKSEISAGEIDISRLKNANQMAPSKSVVQKLQFHPTSNAMITAGLDKTLRIFEIDGKTNQKVQSIYFKDMPIYNAQFINNGDEVIATGRRSYFYTVNIQKGTTDRINGILGRSDKSLERFQASPDGKTIAFPSNSGQIVLVSGKTKQWMSTIQMNGTVKDVAWSQDGNSLWSIGMDSEIYMWDIRKSSECVHRWKDQEMFKPTCIAASPNLNYFACGDYSGIVNIYNNSFMNIQGKSKPKPIKSITNLTTPISELMFNHDSQVLGMFSRNKKDQFKLVHLPTCTVFSNWPTQYTPLGYVQTFDFSPNSGFVAIGNDKGKVLLYRLKHFTNY